MTCPRLLALFIVLLISTSIIGQSGKNPSPSDITLAEQLHDKYEDAQVAARSITDHYLFDFDKSTNKVIAIEQNHRHLMALEANATYQPYKFYDDMSSVISAGATYQNKKKTHIDLRRENFTSKDYFHTDAKVAFFDLQFATVGFQYKIHFDKKYKDVKYLTSVYFHEDIPAQAKTISFSIPSWLEVEIKEINFDGYDINHKIVDDGDLKKHTYRICDIDARTSEPNAPGASHIYPHILVLTKSYEQEGIKENLFSSTQDLYNWYRSLVDMMDDDVAPLESLVSTLIDSKSSDIDNIKAIYYWVQDNIRYIAFEDGIAGFKPDECQNVFQKKYGDCKGMANLCKQMLTIAGYDARLTWIGTKRIAYDYSLPTLSADNHMICTVMLDGMPYFLDPTESFGAFDEYAERIQGRPALIENGDQYIIESVPVMSPSDNMEHQEFHLSIEGESLVGKANHIYHGESKSTLLYQLNNTETNNRADRLKQYLNEGDKDYKIKTLNYSNLANRDQPFDIQYDIQIENKVSQFGNEIYLSMDYYQEWKGASFEERKLDYLLSHKTLSSSKYIITIPMGFKISELPKPINYKSDFLNINAEYTVDDNNIIYTKTMELPKSGISTDEFDDFNMIMKKLSDFYNEQITLIKE